MDILISFVIPCYRSENTILPVVNEIKSVMNGHSGYDYEIIAVNDSSPDGVYNVLEKMANDDKKIKVINLAKNMGKHAAMIAGYSVVKGDYIVNLDDDMQCPTYNVWDLIELLERNECDFVSAEYQEKKETSLKKFGSSINHYMVQIMLEKPSDVKIENFSAMKRFVCDEIVKYKNPYPYIEGLVWRVTNKVCTVKMKERERFDGQVSGFTFAKSVQLFVNGLTAFSVKPLRVATIMGVLLSFVGFVWGGGMVLYKLLHPEVLAGYSSLLATILFIGGMIMLMLGIVGEYLGRIYICINDSPQYVIRNKINIED